MSKMHLRLIAAMALLVIVLAACGGAAGTGGTTGTNTGATVGTETQVVPQTGSTAGVGDTSGGAAAACVGVDSQQLMTAGEMVYTEKCAGCHGAEGAGQGDFPALAANPNIAATDVVALVTTYFSVEGHPKDLTPQDLSGALSYVRGSFGNMAGAVCPDQIVVPVP